MRLRFALSAFLLLSFTALPALAQQQWGRPRPPKTGACFYRDADFRGDYFCMNDGERWPSMPPGFNDQISSIRVFHGARVRIFNDDNFRGVSVRIDGNVGNLLHFRLANDPYRSWNDRISSIAVIGDRDDWDRDRGPGQRRGPQ